ncbi:hypothetical protein F511_23348 [Dorcoceras hygrometricum]|uniref:Uncharacterized protein n=1 Tax=Dorcoceras hygrometricum TaxID=472368 RepID=A0A2Z7CRL7_9LAMI|nr:hypothetical protein F511_23348 [Dorcoceras hygrometricum]
MGNADPNKTKAGNKYEVKPQYEELSKQINMQHAINQCYECMRLSKEISQLDRCNNRQIISCRLYTTVYQPGNHRSVIIGARQPIISWRYIAEKPQISQHRIIDMFKLTTAKGCSIRTLNPQNSTSQTRQGTADLTSCEQIPPILKITRPKTSSNKSVQGMKTRSSILLNTHVNPTARSYTQVLNFYVGTNIPEQSSNQRKKAHPKAHARKSMHGATYCPKLSSFALLSQLKTASKVGMKRKVFSSGFQRYQELEKRRSESTGNGDRK